MKLIDIVNGFWAITPDMLDEIQSIYRAHVRGPKIDISAIEASLGRPLKNEKRGYEVIDNVAILPIDGVVSKRMNLFAQISGGISTELLKRDFAQAMADPTVKGVIMAIDSPGGTVSGVAEVAKFIREARGTKPIYAWSDGQMCSGAIWFGSSADRVYISSGTVLTGSVGVLAKHVDVSQAEEKQGIKTTEITAGSYKRIASQYGPLTADGRADIQEKADLIYSEFINDIAANRGVSVDEVLTRMADGRVFVGRQAIEAGLVDGVATLEDLIAAINQQQAPAGVARAANQKGQIMTLDQMRAEHPDLVAAIVAESTEGMIAAADLQQQIATARAEGAAGERARIQAVEEQLIPGHEALIAALKFDGQTTAATAAQQVLAAEKGARTAALSVIESSANPIVPAAEGGQGGTIDPNAPIEERAKAQWDKDPGMRAEFGDKFESYLAYAKATDSGRARVLGKK
jgi:signal peptide peptidase SppA